MCRARWSDLEKHLQGKSASDRLGVQPGGGRGPGLPYARPPRPSRGEVGMHRVTEAPSQGRGLPSGKEGLPPAPGGASPGPTPGLRLPTGQGRPSESMNEITLL